MPRMVRRRPWSERVKAILNPMDFLLWASEELETRDWDSKGLGTKLGLACNFVFLLARANSGSSEAGDDVFDDGGSSSVTTFLVSSSGPFHSMSWLVLTLFFTQVRPLVWLLLILSAANAFHTMTRSRHYRLFEANVEQTPHTPSAQRVKVQSSPVASSPMRFLTSIMNPETAESRAHPDKTRDVWELAVWDPLPVSLQLFSLFSPGHVLVYMLFLPLEPLDPRPSSTVFNALALQVILSGQMLFLQSRFSRQIKDTAVIHKEVLHEYDTKFVHPRLHPVMRDVGTQASPDEEQEGHDFVELGTPRTVIKKEFHTHPNPNYMRHVDPDGERRAKSKVISPQLATPTNQVRRSESLAPATSARSTARQSLPAFYHPASAQSNASTAAASPSAQLGGSLGAFSHVNSPLKKATSLYDMNTNFMSPRNSREMAAVEQRRASPAKSGGDRRTTMANDSHVSSPGLNPFVHAQRNRLGHEQERYPKMWGR